MKCHFHHTKFFKIKIVLFFYKKLFSGMVLETLTHIPEKRTKKRELTKIKN